ncbi:hypothetical protein J4Q44_G00166570 [Coregonus suidteri]|uniref:Uncharacterized protein n=1 Tax=Coregonus suidteri TaxID=861788 RepID=A0AAN8QR93_9TELE
MEKDGKVVDGSLLGDANGVEPGPGRVKESGKWQKPQFTHKALMNCCLVKWIITSRTTPDKVRMNECRTEIKKEVNNILCCFFGFLTGSLAPGTPGGLFLCVSLQHSARLFCASDLYVWETR